MKLFTLALMATTVLAVSAQAQTWEDNISGTMAFTSDYTFRGISQSDEAFAVQGSIDYAADSGIYASVWASSVDFNQTAVEDANAEVDFVLGYTGALTETAGYDVGAIYYYYPGAAESLNYDYWEVYAGANQEIAGINFDASVNFSPEYFGESGDAIYTQAGFEKGLNLNGAGDITIAGHIGYQMIDDNATFGNEDYTDWSLSISKNIAGFDVTAAYVDTDLSKADLSDGAEARGVLTVSKLF